MTVNLECNLCRGAAVEPVLNRCGHLFCGPCLRREFRRHPHGSCRCPACGRRASPSRLTPIYGQQSSSEPGHESRDGRALVDGCPAGWEDVDMMDEDGAEADVVVMDIDGGATEACRGGPGCVDPMEIDGGADNQVQEQVEDDDVKKMVHLECHICLDKAEEPVATLCGHIYCCPCLFQWLDGRRRKCPVCKKAASESTVTLVLPAPQDGGEKRHNRVR